MINHNENVSKIITLTNNEGYLTNRESSTIEFKQSINSGYNAAYAKTMAAFANNRGGYIIFGVKDNPREIIGVTHNFENFNQEKLTDIVNSLFTPEIIWEINSLKVSSKRISSSNSSEEEISEEKLIGWIYTKESDRKPIIAQRNESKEKISCGDIFYRYRAKNEKIKYAEITKIIAEMVAKEQEKIWKFIEIMRKNSTLNLGIINYNNGNFTTPYGVDIAFDKHIITQLLKKAKYIKEGSFNETKGTPVLKVTGNIELAEEIPVPEVDPDISYPYLQKTLAEKLGISKQDLYALIWFYKMKEAKKYSISVTVTSAGKPSYKFSETSFKFLENKCADLKSNITEFEKIRMAYKNRKKIGEIENGQSQI